MRDILLSSCPVMLWVITCVHVLFIVLLLRGYSKSKNLLYLLPALITFGLFYDSLVLALGGVLSESAFLKAISQVRFISHGALIPLIFPICALALNLKKVPKLVVFAITGVLIVLGIAEGFATNLEVREVAGIVRYASSDLTPAWAKGVSSLLSYGTVVPLILTGIYIWIKQKTPFLFLSGFLMFAFSALGPATGNMDLIFYISMFGEVLMVLFFFLYAKKATKN